MNQYIEVRKTYKYRLYRCDKRDVYLHQQINVAGCIWNHALALHKRYYSLTGKYIPLNTLKSHIAHLRMRTQRYSFWKALGSQAVQDVLERLDDAYVRFFKHLAKRPPKYKKVKRYPSFTLKQAGYKLLEGNKVRIGSKTYKFVQHRPMGGDIKTLTVKRDSLGRLWLCFSVVEKILEPSPSATSEVAGFDFGLKTFLVDHTGKGYMSPLFYKQGLKRIKSLSSSKDKKPKGSNNRRKTARLLARAHIRIADKRRDYHFQLAHDLCDEFDVLVFEDLNLTGMKALWGRKVSDLGFGQFVEIVKYVAWKRGKTVEQISRWERTTGKCSACGHHQSLELRERTFHCNSCGLTLDRDHNAALNIRARALAHTTLGVVSPASAGSPV